MGMKIKSKSTRLSRYCGWAVSGAELLAPQTLAKQGDSCFRRNDGVGTLEHLHIFKSTNKQITKLTFFYLLLLLTTFTSCRKIVKDKFEDFPLLPVVNSLLVADKPVQMYLSFTRNINDSVFPPIENATILLYIDGAFAEELTYQGNGLYQSVAIVEPQKIYSCKAIIPNFDTVYCQNMIPKRERILSLNYIRAAGQTDEGEPHPAMELELTNNPLLRSYYEVKIHYFRGEKNDYAYVNILPNNDIMRVGDSRAIFSNEGMKDTIYKLRLNFIISSSVNLKDEIFVELRSINYDYYQYVRTNYLYEKGRYNDPLTSFPVMNIHSNITNGYGIFSGYSFVLSDTISPFTIPR